MPGKIIRKFNSKRGVTLLLALALFLTCAMVGSAVLAAAYSNAGRYTRNIDKQQSYLAVASAAQLVEDELGSSSFAGSYQKVVTETQIPIYAPMTDEDGNDVLGANGETVYEIVGYDIEITTEYPLTAIDSTLDSKLLSDTDPLSSIFLLYHSVPELSNSVTVPSNANYDVKIATQNFELPEVRGQLQIFCNDSGQRSHFDIKVILYDAENGANAVTMVFSALIEPTFELDTESGIDINGHSYQRETYTYGINVTWAAPLIIKGEA